MHNVDWHGFSVEWLPSEQWGLQPPVCAVPDLPGLHLRLPHGHHPLQQQHMQHWCVNIIAGFCLTDY